MTLHDAKVLLSENNIDFQICEYENEAAFYLHTSLFPHIENASSCKVTTLMIASKNQKKNIEIQFNYVDNEYRFVDLCFGDFFFFLLDDYEDLLAEGRLAEASRAEELLVDELLSCIKLIQSGNYVVMNEHDLKKRRWLGYSCFNLNSDDAIFGRQGFEKAMEQISKPKGLLSRLFGTQKQYEIFDWNTYRCIVN